MGPLLLVSVLANVNVRLPAVSKDHKEVALALEKRGSCENGREDTVLILPVPAAPDAEGKTWTLRDSCVADPKRNERWEAALSQVLAEGGFAPLPETRGLEADVRFDGGGALVVTVKRGAEVVATATSARPRSRNGILGGTQVVSVDGKAFYVHVSWLFRGVPHIPTIHEWIPVTARPSR